MVATNVAERTTISQEWTIAEPLAPTRALDLLSATAADQLKLVDGTVLALVRAVEMKDPTTGSHLHRLAAYALLVGRRLGLSADALEVVCCGALLHDVGKI